MTASGANHLLSAVLYFRKLPLQAGQRPSIRSPVCVIDRRRRGRERSFAPSTAATAFHGCGDKSTGCGGLPADGEGQQGAPRSDGADRWLTEPRWQLRGASQDAQGGAGSWAIVVNPAFPDTHGLLLKRCRSPRGRIREIQENHAWKYITDCCCNIFPRLDHSWYVRSILLVGRGLVNLAVGPRPCSPSICIELPTACSLWHHPKLFKSTILNVCSLFCAHAQKMRAKCSHSWLPLPFHPSAVMRSNDAQLYLLLVCTGMQHRLVE